MIYALKHADYFFQLTQNHRITESFRSEKTFKIIESNNLPSTWFFSQNFDDKYKEDGLATLDAKLGTRVAIRNTAPVSTGADSVMWVLLETHQVHLQLP